MGGTNRNKVGSLEHSLITGLLYAINVNDTYVSNVVTCIHIVNESSHHVMTYSVITYVRMHVMSYVCTHVCSVYCT